MSEPYPEKECPTCHRVNVLTAHDGRECMACTLPRNGVCAPSEPLLSWWEQREVNTANAFHALPRISPVRNIRYGAD